MYAPRIGNISKKDAILSMSELLEEEDSWDEEEKGDGDKDSKNGDQKKSANTDKKNENTGNERKENKVKDLIAESNINYSNELYAKPPLLFRVKAKKAERLWDYFAEFLLKERKIGKPDADGNLRAYTKEEMTEVGKFTEDGMFEVFEQGDDQRKKGSVTKGPTVVSLPENKEVKEKIDPEPKSVPTPTDNKTTVNTNSAPETKKEVTTPPPAPDVTEKEKPGEIIFEKVPKEKWNNIEIIFEKVPKEKWNNTGYKFKRKDGKPLTLPEVYVFIREQKKNGNKEFQDTFKPHIKGKDPDGAYPTFEIENPKNPNNKYSAYSFDPELGKKEEQKTADVVSKKQTTNQQAVVLPKEGFNGIRLHSTPSTSDPDYKNKTGNSASVYGPGTKLIITEKENGWAKVKTEDGHEGWVEERFVIPVDKGYGEDYTLYYVKPGDNVEKVLRGIEDLERDTGKDNRSFGFVLWRMNDDNSGVYINKKKFDDNVVTVTNAMDPLGAQLRAVYQSIELKSDKVIRVPTKKGIDKMISSGVIPQRPEWMNAVVKGGRIVQGLMEGIPVGFTKQAGDMVKGLWEMVKSILSGEIIDQLVELYHSIMKMTPKDLLKFLLSMIGVDPDKFVEMWEGKNITTEKRYEYFGEILGRILFEVVFAILTGGAAVAGKLAELAEKLPALNKILKTVKITEKIDPSVVSKMKKVEKVSEDIKKSESVIPIIGKISEETKAILAPYEKLRAELNQVQRKLGKDFTKFDEQLRQLPKSVLEKLDKEPGLLDEFSKRSLKDPDFFKAVKEGDVDKLDELKNTTKALRKPSYKLGKSDGGPGTWQERTTPGSSKDIDFQRKVTGAPQNVEYPVKGPNPKGEVKFDGFDPERNVLLDAKRFEDFPKIVKGKIIGEKNIIDEANRQINAFRKGSSIEWHVAAEEQANLLKELLLKNGITGIKIVFPPKFL